MRMKNEIQSDGTIIANPEGTKLTPGPDEAKVYTYIGGMEVTIKPDGEEIYILPDIDKETGIFSGGSLIYIYPKRRKATALPCGTLIYIHPEGRKTTVQPDGRKIHTSTGEMMAMLYSNEVGVYVFSDETMVTIRPTGMEIYTYPEGRKVIT